MAEGNRFEKNCDAYAEFTLLMDGLFCEGSSSNRPLKRMGVPLNRLQWTNKASLLAPAFCCRRFIVEN
jgi:hypothetical protein